MLLVREDFWGYEGECTGDSGVASLGGAEAKVCKFDFERVGGFEDDVRGFDVAVHDALVVEVFEGV